MLCPHCNIDYKNLTQHIRFKHNNVPIGSVNTAKPDNGLGSSPIYPANLPNIQPQNVGASHTPTLEALRETLELKKLQLEIDNLNNMMNKPNTNVDYVKTILEIQDKAHEHELKLQEQMNDTKLEILKLKYAGGGDDLGNTLLKELLPLLPSIVKKQNATTKEAPQAQTQKEGGEKMDNSQVPPEYLAKIKSGEITEDKAYKDLKRAIKLGMAPEGTKAPTKEEFHKEFEKIKNGN